MFAGVVIIRRVCDVFVIFGFSCVAVCLGVVYLSLFVLCRFWLSKKNSRCDDWLVLSYILCYRLRGRFAALVVSSVFVSLINGFVV